MEFYNHIYLSKVCGASNKHGLPMVVSKRERNEKFYEEALV